MLRKFLSSVLVLTIFAMTLPQGVMAFPRDETIEQLPEGDIAIRGMIRPILDATTYENPSPTVETGAFAFVDDAGQLFDINIDFHTRRYTVVGAAGFLGVGTLTNDQHDALRAFAQDSNRLPPEQRLQCSNGPAAIACALLVAAIIYALESVRDRMEHHATCQREIAQDRLHAVFQAVRECREGTYTNSTGQQCRESARFSRESSQMLTNCMGTQFLNCQEVCGD